VSDLADQCVCVCVCARARVCVRDPLNQYLHVPLWRTLTGWLALLLLMKIAHVRVPPTPRPRERTATELEGR